MRNLVRENFMPLKESHHTNPNDESSMAKSQLKNVMKNAQAMLNMIQGGQQLDAWIQSHLAVVDSKLQDAKNYVENEATETPGQMGAEMGADIGNSMVDDNLFGMDGMGDDAEIIDPIPVGKSGNMDSNLLPPPFPDDETAGELEGEFNMDIDGDGLGDVNVLDIETRYTDEMESDEDDEEWKFDEEDDDVPEIEDDED